MNDFASGRTASAREIDRARLHAAVVVSGGSVAAACRTLGVAPNYLYRRARIVGLDISAAREEAKALRELETDGDSPSTQAVT